MAFAFPKSTERTAGGAYGYRGRIEAVLTSYALNEQELAVVRGEVERDELREVIGAVAGDAAGALSDARLWNKSRA